jgi:hypothetical protein
MSFVDRILQTTWGPNQISQLTRNESVVENKFTCIKTVDRSAGFTKALGGSLVAVT